ncbi:hypothetical protein, partial [Jannaschia seohaensis]|uniref:hypothetical protein n=1 Tax=Jannaschia seohaensis TaxID=475081 RepID=UPI001B85D882
MAFVVEHDPGQIAVPRGGVLEAAPGLGCVGTHECAVTEEEHARNNEQTTTVFEGLLFRIVLPRSVPTRILIAKDY